MYIYIYIYIIAARLRGSRERVPLVCARVAGEGAARRMRHGSTVQTHTCSMDERELDVSRARLPESLRDQGSADDLSLMILVIRVGDAPSLSMLKVG